MKGLMGGFYRISEWIMRFSVINLLWIICSLPFIFLFVSFLFANIELTTAVELLFLIIPSAIVAPFTLFPATAAMFVVVRKWVTGEEDVPLLKTFFGGYKNNYKQSMLGGFFYLFIAIVLVINFKFYTNMESAMQLLAYVFIAFFFVLSVSFINFFSIMVHFHMKFWQVIKNSILFSIGRPITSILIMVSNAFIIYISFAQFTFLIPFFMGSTVAFISFWHFHRVFQKIQAQQEKLNSEQGEETEDEEPILPLLPDPDEVVRDVVDLANEQLEDEEPVTKGKLASEMEMDEDRFKKY